VKTAVSSQPTDRILDALRAIGERGDIQHWVTDQQDSLGIWVASSTGGLRIADRAEMGPVDMFRAKLTEDTLDGPALTPPRHLDEAKVERACQLFARYGTEIGAALLLAALPEAYAAGFGAWVLYGVSRLASASGDLTRRVARTAQFLVNVMTPPAGPYKVPLGSADQQSTLSCQITHALWDEQKGSATQQVLQLRLLHDFMRAYGKKNRRHLSDSYKDPDKDAWFLNQEDLLGTLLTFSVTVFEMLEKFGITWTADDQDAYLHVWDLVGHYLGIGDHNVVVELNRCSAEWTPSERSFLEEAGRSGTIRPQTVPEARALLARIRQRVWGESMPEPCVPPFAEFDETLQPGRILVRALLDDIHRAMPVTRQLWPIRAMRLLVPQLVCDRLALGATPGSDFVTSTLPKGLAITGRFTHVVRPNRVGGRVIRTMCTDVSSRYFTLLIEEGLVIPGLSIGRRLPTGAPPPVGNSATSQPIPNSATAPTRQ
jgi:hypothetical protein